MADRRWFKNPMDGVRSTAGLNHKYKLFLGKRSFPGMSFTCHKQEIPMKKFDHLTSLDAIDPLPCKLGAKVESGKPEETSFHMGHKLKPGFSVKDGKLKYAPPSPTVKPKRFEFIEIPANVQRVVRGGVTISKIKELNRDFDGDVISIHDLGVVFDPQIQPSLNSPTPVVSRKLNNSGISGAFLRKTPLFDPTAHTTLNAKAHIEKLDRMAKEGCRWDLIAKQFIDFSIDFTPKEPESNVIVTLDSLTEIADTTLVEASADLKKASPLTMNTDQIVQWLVALDAAIAAGQIDRAAVASELLRVRRAQLRQCLLREELMNLSGTLTCAIARRFHQSPMGGLTF